MIPNGRLGLPNTIARIGTTGRVLVARTELDQAMKRGAEREYLPIVGVAIYESKDYLKSNDGSYFGLNF